MTLSITQFRLLVALLWGLLIADIAAPGYLTLQVPSVGTVDVRSLLSTSGPTLHRP